MDRGQPERGAERTSLADLLKANRPGVVTPDVYAINRGIDVVIGLLLIANYLRTVGIFIGEDGTVSFSVSGPLVTRRILEAIFHGDLTGNVIQETPRG
ncbi:MAG TPA: hypothetical protein GXX28_11660 [Firmicutes bacterium]|nr:hypothetical protein [Bacillota bacterium]